MKTCTVCRKEKPLNDFYRWKATRDGRMASCKDCHRERLSKRSATGCVDCGGRVSHASVQRCQRCRAIQKRTGGRGLKDGYAVLYGMQEHPNAVGGKLFEHTLVMTQALGRPLVKGETVHHKNGIRDDNRLSNLELWTRSQPAGQRVEDKLAWALEFIRQYRPEWLADDQKGDAL